MVPPVAENETGKPTTAVKLTAATAPPAELRVKLAVIAAAVPGLRAVGFALTPSTSQGLEDTGPASRPVMVPGSWLLPHQLLVASMLASPATVLNTPLPVGAL